jgi:hypothetical protein
MGAGSPRLDSIGAPLLDGSDQSYVQELSDSRFPEDFNLKPSS